VACARGRHSPTGSRSASRKSPLGKPDPTFADVRRELPPDLTEEERARARYRLRVIASDISEGPMLVLPDDIEDYQDEERPSAYRGLAADRAGRADEHELPILLRACDPASQRQAHQRTSGHAAAEQFFGTQRR
jgi:hypothetical protein